jgi:hypothetical protein
VIDLYEPVSLGIESMTAVPIEFANIQTDRGAPGPAGGSGTSTRGSVLNEAECTGGI